MKNIIIVGVLAFVALAMWKVGSALSSDAISMAVGVLLGVLAAVPSTVVCVSMRKENERTELVRHWIASQQLTNAKEVIAYDDNALTLDIGYTLARRER